MLTLATTTKIFAYLPAADMRNYAVSEVMRS